MSCVAPCLIPFATAVQEPFGDPLLDAYLEFLSGRCRPNSVLAARFNASTGISPAEETRFGSSNTAEIAARV